MEMEPIRKAVRSSLTLALLLTFALPLGGVLLGVGLGIGQPGIWAVGIAFLAAGFYGCPIGWVSYGNKREYFRFITAIEEEHLYTVQELASQLGLPEKEVRNRIEVCFSKRWLIGYRRNGDELILNTNRQLSEQKETVTCPACGAKFSYKKTEDAWCPYCGTPVEQKR